MRLLLVLMLLLVFGVVDGCGDVSYVVGGVVIGFGGCGSGNDCVVDVDAAGCGDGVVGGGVYGVGVIVGVGNVVVDDVGCVVDYGVGRGVVGIVYSVEYRLCCCCVWLCWWW